MLRLGWIRVLFVGAAILLLTVAGYPASAQTTPDPLYFGNATLPPVTTKAGDGYLDKIYDEVFARAGLRYEFVNLPSARALMNSNAGDLDGDAARFEGMSSEFTHLVMVPEPFFHVVFAGLYLNTDMDIQTWDDLADYRIGYVRGWKIYEQIFADHKDADVVANAEILMRMLANDRIDVALLTITPARLMAEQIGMPRPFATKASLRKDLFMYLNEKHADKVDILNDALLSIKSDGTYARIVADYIAGEE